MRLQGLPDTTIPNATTLDVDSLALVTTKREKRRMIAILLESLRTEEGDEV